MWFVCSAWHLCYRAARIFLFQTATSTVRNMDMIAGQCWWCNDDASFQSFLLSSWHSMGLRCFSRYFTSTFWNTSKKRDLEFWMMNQLFESWFWCFAPLQSSKHPQISSMWLMLHGPAWKGCPRSANIRVAWFKDQASQGLNHFLPWWFVDFSKYQKCRKGC